MPGNVDLLLTAGNVITAGGFKKEAARGEAMRKLEIIEDGAVAVRGEKIIEVGPREKVLEKIAKETAHTFIHAPGMTLTPGFVDPHTHSVFGGFREDEFALRISGIPYMEILKEGGGILETVRATRKTSKDELLEKSRKVLDRILLNGTTTVEIKSGYGLDLENEVKMLEVIDQLQKEHPVDIIPTFLGAHALPEEYAGRSDDFIDYMKDEVLPYVAERKLARFCDVFCEEGVFSVEQSRRLLRKAKELGLEIRFHADEMVSLGGAELAAELGAASADHLLEISLAGMEKMATADVTATLLPATPFTLMKDKYAPAREMIDRHVPLALASDFNPGSCPTHSIPLIMTLACLKMKMTPEEAFIAVTINAAHSLGLGEDVGSIEPGKQADLVLFDVPNHRFIPYYYGINLVDTVVKKGKIIVEKGCFKEG